MSWWKELLRPVESTPTKTEFRTLEIVGAGLCCAVGYRLSAASCAIRTGIDHFQSSEFITPTGDPVLVSRLPDNSPWGHPRLVKWLAQAVVDCLDEPGTLEQAALENKAESPRILFDSKRCALLVLCGPSDSSDLQAQQSLVRETAELLGLAFHPCSQVLPQGRAGVAQALALASQWLYRTASASPELDQVLLVAADSLLDAERIDTLLAQQRILCPSNRDGLIPGEGAAALCLQRAQTPLSGGRALHITGVGSAIEPARWEGEIPNRSQGLTQAVREACRSASALSPGDLRFRLSDQNGESFYAKEAATAFTRLRLGSDPQQELEHLTLADTLGDIGAAQPVAALAWLWHIHHRGMELPTNTARSAWPTGVVHAANDDGLRAAVIVQGT